MAYFSTQEMSSIKNGLQPSAPQPSGGLGGFLTRNLPNIGSIAAPVIGAALAPETGGLSLAAGLALAGGGGAAGQVAKNAIQKQSLIKNVGGAAESGAIGELTGRGIGKGVGLLGKLVSKPVEAGVAKATEGKALQQTITDTQPYQGVPKNVLQQNNLNGTLAHLKGLGVSTAPADVHAASNFVTGDNGVVSGTVRQLLGNVDSVSTTGVMDTAKQAIQSEVVHLGELGAKGSAANGLLGTVRDTIAGIADKGQGNISGKSDANGVFDTVQSLEQRVRELGGTKATGTNGAEARVLDKVGKNLMDKLSSGGGDNAVATHNLHPEDVAAISRNAPTSQLVPHIVNGINNAKTLSDLRGLQRPFVQASNLAHAADTAAGGALPKAAAGGSGFGGLSSVYEAGSLMHGNPAAAVPLVAKFASKEPVTNVLAKLSQGGKAIQTANNAILPGSATAGGVLSRIAGQATAGTGKTGALQDQAQQQAQVSANTNGHQAVAETATDVLNNSAGDTSGSTDNSPYSSANIASSIDSIRQQGGSEKDIAAFLSNAKTVNDLSKTSPTTGKVTAQQSGQATAGEQALQSLADQLQQNPNVVRNAGTPGQNIPLLGGYIKNATGAGSYEANASNVLDAIARLQTGAAMSKSEEAFYKTKLPQPGDSQSTITTKLNDLQQILSPYLQTAQ